MMSGNFLTTLFKSLSAKDERPSEHEHPAASPHPDDELKPVDSDPAPQSLAGQPEREMVSPVIDFGQLVVRQVAIPRTEIVAVEAHVTLSEVIQVVTEHAISKVPVYEESLDRIVGIVHLRDLLTAVSTSLAGKVPDLPERTARELAREALFVPETISANDLLRQFRARRTHLAIVLDEFGGTAGLVTLEDLLEEIVGDVRDPFDVAPPPIQTLPDGSALIDGLVLIEEVNTSLGLHLEEPDYDTIAGFILGKLGRIPQPGETVEDPAGGVRLKVEAMDRLRISRIRLTRL